MKEKKSGILCSDDFEKTATRVSLVSIFGNMFLSLFKMLAGILAHSGAMISDAVHSASDVFSSIIVIIGVRIAAKTSDEDHPYGHERFECVAALVLAMVLFITGLFIGLDALKTVTAGNYDNLEVPGMLALAAALISIVVKEVMFWFTKHYADRFDSGALRADAWHHRSDALSSVGALIGIAGARLGYPVLDPVASLIICLFIIKAAYDIFRDAVGKMVDESCDEDTDVSIRQCALAQPGVLTVDLLQTRVFGNKIYVDMEISADGNLTLTQGHDIAEQVHTAIEETFPKVKHIMIHVNPYQKG